MATCKICGRPIVETDMDICRKCRNGEKTTGFTLIKEVFQNIIDALKEHKKTKSSK